MNNPHIHAQDVQSRLYRVTNALEDMAAGCDPEFDNQQDELEREFAELRLQLCTN